MKRQELIEWYSFDEKKPSNGREILVYDDTVPEIGAIAAYADDYSVYDYDGQAPIDQVFTHWAYLPTFNTFTPNTIS